MSDAVGGRGIGCQIGRTSPWSCFTGQGVAQSPLCLGGLVAAGRFAGQVAHGTECGGQKLICTTVRLERLFVANVLNQ